MNGLEENSVKINQEIKFFLENGVKEILEIQKKWGIPIGRFHGPPMNSRPWKGV